MTPPRLDTPAAPTRATHQTTRAEFSILFVAIVALAVLALGIDALIVDAACVGQTAVGGQAVRVEHATGGFRFFLLGPSVAASQQQEPE